MSDRLSEMRTNPKVRTYLKQREENEASRERLARRIEILEVEAMKIDEALFALTGCDCISLGIECHGHGEGATR